MIGSELMMFIRRSVYVGVDVVDEIEKRTR